jgi:ParB/RepB/Spo0J family partition protein
MAKHEMVNELLDEEDEGLWDEDPEDDSLDGDEPEGHDVDHDDPDIGDVSEVEGAPEASVSPVFEIALDAIDPDANQVRDEGADEELGEEITWTTVLPPIEVRPHPDPARRALGKMFEIIDGERRWRGSIAAGRTKIRAIINGNALDDGERLLRQLELNAGKKLKPMEEARSWGRIIAAKGWTAQQLADALHKPKSTVSDRLALLDAPAPFQKLFADGTLTAAAAPIVREYRDLPERVLKAAVKTLLDDEYEGWGQFAGNGVPVPVKVVEETLKSEIVWGRDESGRSHMVEIEKPLAKQYQGAVATIKGKKYALDVEAYRDLANAANEHELATSAPREESKWEIEARERRSKERKAHEKKKALRQAQWAAIAPKLPVALDAGWWLFLIRWLVKEIQQDYLRQACNALKIEPPKKSQYGGFQFDKAIVTYAEGLGAPKRAQLALQLLIAHDLQVSPYDLGGPERMSEAAKLLKIDLSRIKPAGDEKANKAPAKRSNKRKR